MKVEILCDLLLSAVLTIFLGSLFFASSVFDKSGSINAELINCRAIVSSDLIEVKGNNFIFKNGELNSDTGSIKSFNGGLIKLKYVNLDTYSIKNVKLPDGSLFKADKGYAVKISWVINKRRYQRSWIKWELD